MEKEDETVRFPTKLDPAAIYERLAGVRDAAQQSGLPETEIGKVVIRSMGLIGGKPEHQGLAKQLQIIAMNLKNLK